MGANVKSEKSPDEWAGVLDNLTGFLSASAALVNDLKQTVQKTEEELKQASKKKPEKDKNCPCLAHINKKDSKPVVVASAAKKNCICCPGLCSKKADTVKTPQTPHTPQTPQTPQTPPPKDKKGPCICGPQKAAVPSKTEKPGKGDELPCKDLKGSGSADTIVLEPQYETFKDDCICDARETKSQNDLTQQSTKDSSVKLNKKQNEQFAKEKSEKLVKLKESVTVLQKDLSKIQEEIRQLERLYQDYSSFNTSEGSVNPAALYREIMKPQSVPYIKPTPVTQLAAKKPCTCEPSQNIPAAANMAPKQSLKVSMNIQEHVSVLSAVPLDQAYI